MPCFGGPPLTEARARAIALAQVPGGRIETAELEHERGKHVWSFDIRSPGSSNVIEVQVEGSTGRREGEGCRTCGEMTQPRAADDWHRVDKAIDRVLEALRASRPNPELCKKALGELLAVMDNPSGS